jgi:hypothetical protein
MPLDEAPLTLMSRSRSHGSRRPRVGLPHTDSVDLFHAASAKAFVLTLVDDPGNPTQVKGMSVTANSQRLVDYTFSIVTFFSTTSLFGLF